jgi:hypothetical protein
MICGDMQSAKVMMDMRVEEAQRVARSRRLERRTGSGLWTWVQQQVCQILISLGHRLVIVGRRLERRSLPWHSL